MVRTLVQAATTVFLAVFCVALFGASSYVSLPRESAPDIKIPVIVVSTPYIGVSPEDIEGLITIPMENELASLTDVKEMTSSSAEGVSVVAIEFEPEVDIDEALQKVRDRVNRARPKLPDDAEEPSVSEVSFSDIPILLVTIAGPVDEQELKALATDLEDEVTRIAGVLEADVTGGREREIKVQVYPDRLSYYGLKLDDVIGALQGENVNIPGGNVTSGRATFLLRTPGEFTTAQQIESVALKRVGDRPVFLTDVARVTDSFVERSTYSRMNGTPSVTLSVKKRTGSNILQVAQDVKALVAERAEAWPAGVTYRVLGDQSENIEDMVSELQNNIVTALILVVGVILLFMGIRSSMFVAIAIPLSMLASFLVLEGFDFTLNMVVLFSLILALGMLVDNAIVVVENIYRHLEEGKSRAQAAVDGTNEVAVAVAASTATTVAAFFPMVFWSGIMGQFMGYLPKTVIIVLTSSLAVAVFALPVFTSRLMPRVDADDEPDDNADIAVEDTTDHVVPSELGGIMRRYYDVLSYAISHRYMVLGGGLGTLVLSFVAYGALNSGVEFFPATDPDRATVAVQLPEGADLEATDRVVRTVEQMLSTVENVDVFVAEVGVAGGSSPLEGSSQASNRARITVDFRPSADKARPGETVRKTSTNGTIKELRALFATVPGAKVTINQEEMGPPVGKPVEVQVRGDDFHEVGAAAGQLLREIARIDGTADLETDYLVGRPELRLRIDRGAAKRVGVSTAQIGNVLRSAVAGTKASALRDGDEEHDIVVELVPEEKSDLQKILTLRVPGRLDTSPDTFPVPLSAVASYELAGGSGTIKHTDQDLVVTISGDVTSKDREAEVQAAVAAFLAEAELPPGMTARLGGSNDEQKDAQAFLGWAFGLAVSLILMVLVAQFDSLAMPVIILITVLLSLVGVLWGLIITGTPFGIIMTGIGVISLAGVVVNNAIVLLDYVQQLRKRGMDMREAVLKAGVTRFRPVMLTAITTTLGLVPMAVGISVDFFNFRLITGSSSAQFWGPMAVAVIFGLSFATVLTLVMVPTLYSINEDIQGGIGRVLARARRPATSPSEAPAGPGLPGLAKVLPFALLLLGGSPTAHAMTLEEAWAAAETHNLDLALSAETSLQTGTFKWQALSALFPRVDVQGSYDINEDEVLFDFGGDFGDDELPDFFQGIVDAFSVEPTVVQPKTNVTGTLSVYQPLMNGAALPTYVGARLLDDAGQLEHQRVRQQVRAGVARVFYGLATAREAQVLSEQSLVLAKHQLELADKQLAAGLVDQRVVLQARLGVARADRDLLGAREQLTSAEQAFERVVGVMPSDSLELPDVIEVPESVDDAVGKAMIHRPDLKANSLRTRVAKLERVANDLGWAPSFDFTFSYTYQQVPGFIPENWQWRIGVGAKWNIFDGGLRVAKSRELNSRRRQAEIVVARQRQQLEEEVRVAWERLRRARTAYESVLAEISLAQTSLDLAQKGFEAGSVTWLDVEQATLALAGAELAKVTERMNRDLAAIDLQTAIGRL